MDQEPKFIYPDYEPEDVPNEIFEEVLDRWAAQNGIVRRGIVTVPAWRLADEGAGIIQSTQEWAGLRIKVT